jgi:exodeoxyribonuclease V beta subunit
MYVALTRARHQAVVWWAGSFYGRESPLTRLLFAVDEHGNVGASWGSTPRDDELEERLEQVAARAPGRISVERSTLGAPAHWSPPLEPAVALGVARFGRGLDLSWRRTSYSDITAGAHEAWVASEPEESGVRDEPESATAAASTAEAGAIEAGSAVQSAAEVASPLDLPLASLPVGTRAGSFVHRVLQLADFAAADLDAELAARVAEQDRAGTLAGDGVAVVAGLRAALETPLGALAGGRRLRDAGRADRLDELEFELPLAGGDEPAGEVSPSALGEALRAHLPAGDPLAAYAARLEDPALRGHVRGFLTGSIDLVLRLPGPRFAVIDYKTNWLAAPGEALRVEHYRREALAAEMARAHYGLQALLYTVALHRYLRWRLAGYDPDEHLAGVLYLFLRGMVGADTPVSGGDPYGVFAWRAPGGLVHALSEVLDGR